MNINNLKWKNFKLYNGTKDTGYSVEPYPKNKNLYYSRSPGGRSTDYYNISWAKQHTKDMYLQDLNEVQKPDV